MPGIVIQNVIAPCHLYVFLSQSDCIDATQNAGKIVRRQYRWCSRFWGCGMLSHFNGIDVISFSTLPKLWTS
jgi:hypothetical protein